MSQPWKGSEGKWTGVRKPTLHITNIHTRNYPDNFSVIPTHEDTYSTLIKRDGEIVSLKAEISDLEIEVAGWKKKCLALIAVFELKEDDTQFVMRVDKELKK